MIGYFAHVIVVAYGRCVSTNEKSLGHTGIRGAVVVAVSQAIKLGTQTLSVAILARLLTPTDFGVVASVAPVTALVILFQDFGLQQAIVQRREISQDQLSPAFWFTLSLGLGCGVSARGSRSGGRRVLRRRAASCADNCNCPLDRYRQRRLDSDRAS